MGHCVEIPDITVMGRDHDEVASLARQAFAGRDAPPDKGLSARAGEA